MSKIDNTVRNAKLRAERHAKRMTKQTSKHHVAKDGFPSFGPAVPRGTARNERRKPLQVAYARRHELAQAHKDAEVVDNA